MPNEEDVVTYSASGSYAGMIGLLAIAAAMLLVSKRARRLQTFPQRTLAVLLFLLIWEVAVRVGLMRPAPIPTPSSVLGGLAVIVRMGKFWEHALVSIGRVALGYALALAVAIPLGFAVGWFDAIARFLDPALQTMRQVPPFALYPAFILFFGIGELPKVLLITLAALWWILLNTITAVKNVDALLIKIARSMGTSQWGLLWKIAFPTAVPTIITGMRYASTEVVLALVTVEMMGAYKGLGLLLATPHYWEVLMFMTMLGVAANYALLSLERRLSGRYG